MIRKTILLSAIAGLTLISSSRADEPAVSSSAPANTVLTSQISCKGYSSVPMTADQEQSLPMKLVANLSCGQEVAVLSDMESYTVSVRTNDGASGYVARLFLTPPVLKSSAAAPVNAALTNGKAVWQEGAAGSTSFPSGKNVVESLTANGITVQVSLQDTGWKLRADVAVKNAGAQPIYVLPKLLTLDEVAPSRKLLRFDDPSHIAKALNHQLLWTASSAGPENGLQPDRSASAGASANVSYKMPSTAAPNLLAQQQALEEIAAKSQTALVDMSREIKTLSLRECTLKSGENTAGAVWFDRDGKSRQLVLHVPVGGVIFEFPLSFDK
ncbi:MAG TPA: hypothetical protein VEI73_03370 [Candidatus Acidoferrum sp.]|nr:hypothetical protein [Candidatus Acidoferrum sp.]